MFLPLTSDAELKHWPIATASLIVVHVVTLVIQNMIPDLPPKIERSSGNEFGVVREIELDAKPGWYDLMLSHGDGLHPLQWLTSMLMHDGWGHLFGNMVFLWVFGHVVEGIVGSVAFASLYLGMGIVQNFVGQLLFLGSPNLPSLGASGAIYSIMVVAALWAPQDNIQCMLLVTFRPMLVNIPILIMGLFYFLWDFGIALFQRFTLGTELLHVTGAVTGFVTGFVLLATGRIDCDERDMFSMIREATGRPRNSKPKPKPVSARREPTPEELIETSRKLAFAWRTFDAHFAAANLDSAIAQLHTVRKFDRELQWDEQRLLDLLKAFHAAHRWDDVLRYSELYLSKFSPRGGVVRLNAAHVLAMEKGLPRKALKMLGAIDTNQLDSNNRQVARNLAARCQQLIAEGTIETRDE